MMSLPHPLHEPKWLADLRQEGNAVDHLFCALLEFCPLLTVNWLDRLLCNGPKMGFPGLYTLYDVNTFAIRNQALIDQVIQSIPLVSIGYDVTAQVAPLGSISTNPKVRRRRRCRVAVYCCVQVMSHYHATRFARARAYENTLRQPFTPFCP